MSDELVERVADALLRVLSDETEFFDIGSVDMETLARAAIKAVVAYQTADVIEQMKAGRGPMPEEPGHPDLYWKAFGSTEMEFDGDRD